jgi:indole-3-glycerol phosphate synthase/phosphoribosylanthranilate isomerase
MLAGGLSQDNINSALAQLSAQDLFGLDINSGVEDSPGVKSREKLNSIFTQIRNY